jgi:hypothetical protein
MPSSLKGELDAYCDGLGDGGVDLLYMAAKAVILTSYKLISGKMQDFGSSVEEMKSDLLCIIDADEHIHNRTANEHNLSSTQRGHLHSIGE